MPAENPFRSDDVAVTPRRTVGDYLAAIKNAERHFGPYHDRCDEIDKRYADLEFLAGSAKDRELQVFWSNMQVMAPAIYARPPIPVVVPRFKDQRELPREASELLERVVHSAMDAQRFGETMEAVRDDVLLAARGQVWVRYVATGDDPERFHEGVAIEHVDRKDYLEEPARYAHEASWRARRAYLTRDQIVRRFGKDMDLRVQFARQDGQSDTERAAVWEVWDRAERIVVWVSEGCEAFLDAMPPPVNLEGFFPCPRPAYGTLQRRSTIPVPDFVYVQDQLEEINEFTSRIHALADGLRLRGFYAGGAPEVREAVEAALDTVTDNAVLIPVSNYASMGGAALRDSIVWLPMQEVAATVESLIALRRQVIDDVYQITGISDILRGASDPNETAKAQQIKQQWGSVRIRQRQNELVRFARDVVCIVAEIAAEQFGVETLALMAQTKLPRQQEIDAQTQQLAVQARAQAAQAQAQLAQAMAQDPQAAQQMQGQVQQAAQQVQAQLQELQETVTLEKVAQFLADEKLRPFVLDIETDSTIQPDEDAEKQRRMEFLGAMTPLVERTIPAVQQLPMIAPFLIEVVKFAAAPFRAGRAMEGVLEDLGEKITAMAEQGQEQQGPPPDPEKQAKAQAIQQQSQIDRQLGQVKLAREQQEMQLDVVRHQSEIAVNEARVAEINARMQAKKDEAVSRPYRDAR